MLDGILAALAGLGFFLAGLHMLSEAVRGVAARRLRMALGRLARWPFASVLAGSMLGAVSQSTSAAAFVCIGLFNARAISFTAALTISAWASVGTSVLVFLASIDLRSLALLALAMVGLLYISSFNRDEAGRRASDLLLAIGTMLFGLTMLKATGHQLADNIWVREFFTFAAESPIYSFLIGFLVTLVMQSSSTVSALAVMLSATGLIPLEAAMVLVCGANAGSGMSVALITTHLSGLSRQVALWQAATKLIGALTVLPLVLFVPERETALSVPLLLSLTFLLVNISGALLSALFRGPLLRLLEALAPTDLAQQQFAPEFIVDEAAEDPDTAYLLARREQAKLVGLLPGTLDPVREAESGTLAPLDNGARRALALGLAMDISAFVSEALTRHPTGSDVTGLLQLQSANAHLMPLIETLHSYVGEISAINALSTPEQAMCNSMTETLHLLLDLIAEQAMGDESNRDMVERMTAERGEVMTRFRQHIAVTETTSNSNRESLFVATGLFERTVWLARQLASDLRETAEVSKFA